MHLHFTSCREIASSHISPKNGSTAQVMFVTHNYFSWSWVALMIKVTKVKRKLLMETSHRVFYGMIFSGKFHAYHPPKSNIIAV